MRGCAHPSFGMAPTFPKKKEKKIQLKSRCHTKRRMGVARRDDPSFGMTPTQAIRERSLLVWAFHGKSAPPGTH